MRYRLTFLVDDKSEEATFVEKHYCDKPVIKLSHIVKWGCDVAKILDQNPDHSTYSFYDATILED